MLELLWIRFTSGIRNLQESLQVIWRYYRRGDFAKVDLYLIRAYLLRNPYRISKQFLMKKGEKNIYAYGETPLTTMEQIARACGIQSSDVVYELGSGRGRACFWLHFFIGCRVVGIEYVPEFVRTAQHVRVHFGIEAVRFHCIDILQADLSAATVVYFYGTMADEAFISGLIEKLKKLPAGAKVITVSFPLTAYTDQTFLQVVKIFSARFFWGEADIYLHVKRI